MSLKKEIEDRCGKNSVAMMSPSEVIYRKIDLIRQNVNSIPAELMEILEDIASALGTLEKEQ